MKINYRRNSFLAVAVALALLVNHASAATFTWTGAKIDLNFSGTVTVKSLTVDGELMTRNKVYSSANLTNVLSGSGLLYTLEGVPPKGTVIGVF